MCWFGDWPEGILESTESFLQAVVELGSFTHQRNGAIINVAGITVIGRIFPGSGKKMTGGGFCLQVA
jgi:hypothetical protein